MKSAIIGMLAETSLHPGTEQSTGIVDMPVAREVSTGYPVIVGSSLKGAIKDKSRQSAWVDLDEVFGKSDNAGAVAVTDARLLLLPVRSLTGHFKWVTCPYLLERFCRDSRLAGLSVNLVIPDPKKDEVVVAENGLENLYLEELSFKVTGNKATMDNIIREISPLILHESVRNRLQEHVLVMSDDNFNYFATYGLQVNARNELYEDTKTSKNLWYEETLPPDSLFYALLLPRRGKEQALEQIEKLFRDHPYLQVGGNETVGQGWCAVSWLGGV